MNARSRRSFAVAWQDKEYRWSLRKAERALHKAALLGATILVVLGIEIKGADAAGPPLVPPYAYGDCSKATIGVAWADCRVDKDLGRVGVAAFAATVGAAAARGQVGTPGDFNNSGYYRISCNINYVAKFFKTSDWPWITIATLHANLFVDGVKYTDDFLGADRVSWPWEMPSIWKLWSALRNRSWHIERRLYVGRGQHALSCGLEDRVVANINPFAPWLVQSVAMVAVGDVTRINWVKD